MLNSENYRIGPVIIIKQMISTEESSQLKYLKENPLERRPTNPTSESSSLTLTSSMSETVEVVPEVGACYTIVEEHGDIVVYSGFDISSDDDNDRLSTDNSDSDISGYEGDCDIAQGEVSENETDSDTESRVVLARKLRSVLHKGGVDSISDMPLESMFESVEEVCDNLGSDELTTDCLGTGYTDEFETDSEDGRKENKNFNVVYRTNVDENLTPNKLFKEDRKKSGLVKRKLFEEPNMDGSLIPKEFFVVENRKNSGLVKRKLSEDEDYDFFLRILGVEEDRYDGFFFYRNKKAK